MKRKLFITLAAGLIALSTPALFADDAKPADKPANRPNREELREKLKNMTPEERKEWMDKHPEFQKQREEFAKNLGLNPDELKKLTPEERQAKIKEAVAKKIAELQKKKTDGTITDKETEILARLEKMKNFGGERRGPGRGGPGHQKDHPEKSGDEKKSDDKK